MPEIQDVADFLGDSLQLAQEAKKTNADVICFAGVHFMAETAKILNPDRIVVVPDLEAGCSLAEGCPAGAFRAWRAKHPGAVAVTYINCTAAVKAESDWICTSATAVKVVRAIPKDKKILFAPDRNLGRHVMKHAEREMELWPSTCVVHERFSERKIIALRERNKDALFIAHPECEPQVLRMADYIGSTTALLKYVQTSDAKKLIVGTEPGILHQMRKAAPDKTFIEAPPEEDTCSCNECPFMSRNTLEKAYLALRDLKPQVDVPPDVRRSSKCFRYLPLSSAVIGGLFLGVDPPGAGSGPVLCPLLLAAWLSARKLLGDVADGVREIVHHEDLFVAVLHRNQQPVPGACGREAFQTTVPASLTTGA